MFKKFISSVLIVGQLGFAAGAMASGTDAASSATPELTLFAGSVAVMGKNLSHEETQAQISQLFADYEKAAPQEGQAERIEQAMVAMNIYTPEQAHQFTQDAQNLSANSTQSASDQLAQLLTANPAGAQFSACDLSTTLAVFGGGAVISGSVIWIIDAKPNHPTDSGVHTTDTALVHDGELVLALGIIAVADAIVIGTHSKGC